MSEMYGALKSLSGSEMQSFLSDKPTHSWFEHSWPTSYKYGYANVEIKGVGTQGAGEAMDFDLSALPHDVIGRIVFELQLPAIDHHANRGMHKRYALLSGGWKDKVALKDKRARKQSSSSSSSSDSSSSDSWTSSTDSSSSSSSSTSTPSRPATKTKVLIDDDIRELPSQHAYFNQEIAHVGVKRCSLFVAGVEITPCSGEFMNVMDNVSQTFDHNTDEEVGRYNSDLELYKASLRPQTRYFEPLLSIGESFGRHWPNYLARHIKTHLRVEMNPLYMWYVSTDHSIPQLLQANRELSSSDIKYKCFADVYVLSSQELEQKYTMQCKQFLLLQNQWTEKEVPPTTTDTPIQIDLPFKNPCMQFLFTVQEKRNRDMKDYNNCWYKKGDSIVEAKFTVDGSDVIGWRKAPFWRQFFAKGYSRKPTRPIYVIPANMYPEKADLPSGTIDCSACKPKLWLKLPPGMQTAIVKVWTRSYNMITFSRQQNGRHVLSLSETMKS